MSAVTPARAEPGADFGGVAKSGSGSGRSVSLAEAYERWAATYDAPNPLHALEERVLIWLLPAVAGMRVLDAACGTGRWLEKLLGWGAGQGFGVDLSAGMLNRAARKPALRGRCVRADCLALPFAAASADLILCSLAAGHVPSLHGLARELSRVARPNGEVFVTDFHPLAYARGWRRTFHDGDEVLEVPSQAHTLERVRLVFEEAGFQATACVEPRLGEPERAIFTQRGKAHLFSAACETPALYIFRFQRTAPAAQREERS